MALDKKLWNIDENQQLFIYPDGEGNEITGDPLDLDERAHIYAASSSAGSLSALISKAFPKSQPATVPLIHPETKEIIKHVPKMYQVPKIDPATGKVMTKKAGILGPDGQNQKDADGNEIVQEIPIMEDKQVMLPVQPNLEDREAFYGLVCFTFQVKRFDPKTAKGNTKAALQTLWGNFIDWSEAAQKKPDTSPTSSTPSEAELSVSSPEPLAV